jgi:tRNA A-37 threonylcarbamoyl transferase component Bud32
LATTSKHEERKLNQEIASFCKHVAGSCQITAACLCSNYASSLATSRTATQVLLVVKDFQPRLMNYAKAFGTSSLSVLAVDKWIFERDVDRGILGEALAGGLIFPYKPLVNGEYLHVHEVALKKRLILELLQNLVLDFPELSYEFYVKPKYFMYQTLLTRARLFPPMLDSLSGLIRQEKNLHQTLRGFVEALNELREGGIIRFSGDYVTLSKQFIDKAQGRRATFKSLLRTGHRALFASLIGMLPQMMNALSHNKEPLLNLRRILSQRRGAELPIEDPDAYVYVKTASGLAPLANRVDITSLSRKILCASTGSQVTVSSIGGILNDVYLVRVGVQGGERRLVVKRFRDWSNFKWFPLTLWSVGTKTFAVLGSSRLEREYAINRLLRSYDFAAPEVLFVSPHERLIFMEYIPGEDLSRVVKKVVDARDGSELSRNLELIKRAGSLLGKVHSLGITLGDAKPENILADTEGVLYLTDLEQAGRNGDKSWDIAEFLYYAGHDISPFANARRVGLMARTFIIGYLQAGGNPKTVKDAGKPKYTKVFSIFTFPHTMLELSSVCKRADMLKEKKGEIEPHRVDGRPFR